MRIPLSCRVGIGLILLTFILIGLGVIHCFVPSVLLGIWFVWLLASFPGYWQIRREPFFTEAFPDGDPTWNPLFLRIGMTVMLLICWIHAMTPETRHDPYDYHLTIPTLYLAYQGIVEIPWHVFSYMPKNCEILYGLALGVGNDSLAKVIHLAFGCLCTLSISSFIKRIAGHEASMLAALLTVTLPVFGFIATASYIDLARAFWELSALYMLFQVWEETDPRTQSYSLILSGLFAGMALGTKYVSFLVFFPPYLILAAFSFWWRVNGRRVWLLPVWGLAILLPISPWFFYNILWTGNPIYPLFPSIFGLHIPAAQAAYEFIRNHAPDPSNFQLFRITGYTLKRIGGLLLDGNALVLISMVSWSTVLWWKNQSLGKLLPTYALRGLLLYSVLSSILFLVGCDNMDGRFFFSTLVVLVIPTVFFLYALVQFTKQSSSWGKYVIPGFALILFSNALTYRYNQLTSLQESPLPIFSERQRDQWLSRRFVYYKVAYWANHNLPQESIVLGMGYPLRIRHMAKIKYGYIPFLENPPQTWTPSLLVQRLHENGITHIVKPFITPHPTVDLSILVPNYLKPIYSHRGIVLYELIPDGKP